MKNRVPEKIPSFTIWWFGTLIFNPDFQPWFFNPDFQPFNPGFSTLIFQPWFINPGFFNPVFSTLFFQPWFFNPGFQP